VLDNPREIRQFPLCEQGIEQAPRRAV
jgi:hypothetical protein